jgi:hypothetical protein
MRYFSEGVEMLKALLPIGSLACVLSFSAVGWTQAMPTATGRGSFQAGFGATYAEPDYGQKPLKGVSLFADFDLSQHLGLEADLHYVSLITPTDIGENTYLVGPRAMIPYGRFDVYVKVLGGYGDLVIQEIQDNVGHPGGFYFAYAGGGGIDIRATNRITIRAIDVEGQKWPHYGNGLSPILYTFGAAYRFH